MAHTAVFTLARMNMPLFQTQLFDDFWISNSALLPPLLTVLGQGREKDLPFSSWNLLKITYVKYCSGLVQNIHYCLPSVR